MSDDLIFDIGLHKGKDSDFYLKKGFRVVGIEAIPDLATSATALLQPFVESGRMVVVNKALSHRSGETLPFYVNPAKDDWGSLEKHKAEKGMANAVEIRVETITLPELFDAYGVPYYMKTDIEGGDHIVLEQLAADARRPTYISVEANEPRDFDRIAQCGYRSVQIVNQWLHPFTVCPNPPLEGSYVPARFDGETSGLFGRELPANRWIDVNEAKNRYIAWNDLRHKDDTLAIGWLDIHARR
ncbi:FkbM family methyltransferase [Propylenella binzhouense]|uniref:FkbM family methyltransferase n=1 Tax=Propylenella binzhouense TaxID=2555902 RepID=UPI00136C55A7|nr:FkbM family methyltransferase [Propylenella binzhouense]